MGRLLYSLTYNNLLAGGKVGDTLLVYVDSFELDQIKESAKRHKITIESIKPEEVCLFSDVVDVFMAKGTE
jgi:hypothetical protein